MSALHDLPSAAVADIKAAVTLLEKGRVQMALVILRGLPARLRVDLAEAASWARPRAHLDRPPVERRSPRQARLEWLRRLVADPVKRERAKELLGFGDELLDRALAGAPELSPGQRRKLRRELRRELGKDPPKGRVPKVRTRQPKLSRGLP